MVQHLAREELIRLPSADPDQRAMRVHALALSLLE